MNAAPLDAIDNSLLNDWQRDLPILPCPFAEIAKAMGITEDLVLQRLAALKAASFIARVGGVVRPNTIGASTLAAMSVPDLEVDEVASILSAEPGANHVYLRENDWNLWFVVTGADRAAVNDVLTRVETKTGRTCLDLRLEKPYHIDLGFTLDGRQTDRHTSARHDDWSDKYSARPGDRQLVQVLTQGIPLVSRPFRAMAQTLHRSEDDIIERIGELADLGILPRLGVIVRHRALGWRSNAMVVWDVDAKDIDRAGAALAALPGINLCYRRTRYSAEWPFNLYCMVHAKSRQEAIEVLNAASQAAGLGNCPSQILFSQRCFKQTGAQVARLESAA